MSELDRMLREQPVRAPSNTVGRADGYAIAHLQARYAVSISGELDVGDQ